MAGKDKLLLVDGHSLAFRGFYAMYGQLESMKNQAGLHTNALYAFHNMMKSILETEQPSHALVAFDAGSTTFRHETFEDYKGGRDSMPSEMAEQMPYFDDLLEAFGVNHYQLENYEADDIIGTLATEADDMGMEVIILTGDRDLTQLATDSVTIYYTKKGVSDIQKYTPEVVKEDMGVRPDQVTDLKGLMGDSSDNIPGVTSIGEKRAVKLIDDWGSVEGVYENIDQLNASKMKENLVNEEEIARMSKDLATIDTKAPIKIGLEDTLYEGADQEKLVAFYREMSFNSHLSQMDTSGLDQTLDEVDYSFLEEISAEHFKDGQAFFLEMLDDDYHKAPIIGVAWGDESAVYTSSADILFESEAFKKWAEDPSQKKLVFDAKAMYVAAYRRGVRLEGIDFDILLASYLLTQKDNRQSVADVCFEHGYQGVAADTTIYGKGAKQAVPEDMDIVYDHLANKVKAISQLSRQLGDELKENNQEDLLLEMELPLSRVLADMEIRGITVQAETLEDLQVEFGERLEGIRQKIYDQAGEEFNINSPKQMGEILYNKMGLPVLEKTSTGNPSTNEKALNKLQASGQAPIVDDILEYRQIAKIQSTYVEGLLQTIDDTGRVHTRFLQTVARTGRLSSVDPNLQNIPIRTEEGRQIRRAFTANHEGWKLFASDYSQIELRIMAHMSDDQHLKEAFLNQEDIHTTTAARINNLDSLEQVTPNMRSDAKAINFGIIYGMSAYGLSESLGISRKEAQDYIDTYFEKYPGVQDYIENIQREARHQGYVETLFNRRRYLPEINSKNFNQRSFAERTAQNTPIQGSAADIIKMAMLEMDQRLKEEGLQARMLLQVHDELIFEVPEDEIVTLETLVKDVMENIVDLSVPLVVESSYGDTWYDI